MTLAEYLKTFLSPPSKEILQRQELSMELFTAVLTAFGDAESDIRRNNKVDRLLSKNLNSHPQVHRGYYDSKYQGILYVMDVRSGQRIRKDESILLPSGEFIHEKSPDVWHSPQPPSALKDTFLKALDYDIASLEALKNLVILHPQSGMYLPFSPEYVKKFITPNHVSSVFSHNYTNFCLEQNLPTLPENADDFSPLSVQFTENTLRTLLDYTGFGFFFPENMGHTAYQVPKDSPYFPSYMISDGDSFSESYDTQLNAGIMPGFYVNYASTVRWNPSREHQCVELSLESSFGFKLLLKINSQSRRNEARASRNNEGDLLDYSTRIDEYKVMFKMTPQEKATQDRYKLELEPAIAAWSARRKACNTHTELALIGESPTLSAHQEPIYLGVELELLVKEELQNRDSMRKVVSTIADSAFGEHCIMKRDGSIGDYGIEIVTIPATLEYHKEMFLNNFFNKEHEFHTMFMADRRCGMHVHISKKSFTPADLGKFMAFINSKENIPFIDSMANRSANTYCERTALVGKNVKGIDLSAKVVRSACRDGILKSGLSFRGNSNFNRRQAVNLANAHTVEVRSFKSSTDKSNVFRKMEFCESLIKFVRQASLQQMTVYDYVNFLLQEGNKSQYKILIRWLAAKGYVGHTRKKYKNLETGKPITKLANVYSKNLVLNPHAPKPPRSYQNPIKKEETSICV